MVRSTDPLPLESRRRDEGPSGPPFRISAVAAVAQVGLCLSVLGVPIYAALILIPPAVPRLQLYERFAAGFGFVAMVTLAAICVALMMRRVWTRRAMLAWATAVLVWQAINLVFAIFVYVPARRELLTTTLESQIAAATQPTTRPAYFDAFANFGIWVMPVLTFLALGGYAWWVIRVMRGAEIRAALSPPG